MKPNVISAADAAREKGCSTQTIYNALDRGDLNGVRMGALRLVLLDDAYGTFQVKETGARLRRAYQEKHNDTTEG